MWRKLLLVVLLFGIGYLIWRRMRSESEPLPTLPLTPPASQPPASQPPAAVTPPSAPTTTSTGSGPRPVVTRVHRGEPPKLAPSSSTGNAAGGARPVITRVHRGAPPERRDATGVESSPADRNGAGVQLQTPTAEVAPPEAVAATQTASVSAQDSGAGMAAPERLPMSPEATAPAMPADAVVDTGTPTTASPTTDQEPVTTTPITATASSEEETVVAAIAETATTDLEPIDINRADREALIALPGIGPVLADRIIAYREEHGPFKSVDDLIAVSGIGERNINIFRKLVYVAND